MRYGFYVMHSYNRWLFYNRYRHKNLVELMGVCRSPPALVLEFMEEGSLFDHLHKKVDCISNEQRSLCLFPIYAYNITRKKHLC